MLVDDDDDDFNIFAIDFEKECEEDEALVKKNELDQYLEERSDGERKNIDLYILELWKMYASKYLVLAMMALDVLVIQVSTIASNSLDPTMVQALICFQNWLTSSSLPLDIGSLMEDIEAYESIDSGKIST
uniref:HAT C-terminal dimerisation domain-containing protein n=1 Tax=Lactuca sativa TaxID=4236 RepID=A0A9R1UN50_LACSA|nr:hypothetical protein LSAT_V11C800395380 [Lactuca sativa]